MKYDGTNWVYIGTLGFSAGVADYVSLAFSPAGQPYVAYLDWANSQKATVMMFNGTNWVNVGTAGFSAGEADYTSLAFNTSGQPYVAYVDRADSTKATVMRYDGTNWGYVGNEGFSLEEAIYTCLAFSPSDSRPYVAYSDFYNYWRATVMKYDSLFVGINEHEGTRLSIYPNPARDKCKVQCAKCNIKSIEILNETGEKVYEAEFSAGAGDAVEVNLDFPMGVYFLRLMSDKTVDVGKLIKK